MRYFVAGGILVLGCLALGQVGGCKNRQADPRPNVIVILVDDLSAGELGCYGSTANNTPQLDKLAASGVRFATCWSTPACLPSRVQLLTGRYGFRTGVYHRRDRLGGPDNDFKITDHLTLPGLLQSAGYRTMVAGKWKLVPPADAGFDHAAIWLSNMRQMSEKERANFDGGVESATTRRPGRTSRYWHPAIRVDGSLVNTDKDDYGPDIFLDRVVDFANRRDHRPFFVYYPMVLPHGPYEPTPPISEGTGPLDASFKLHVRYMDHVIGELASRLDQAGLLTNTIVLVTADNGSVSGGKDEVSERGVHVPLIAFGGPVVARAEPSSRLVDSSDFLPTVLEFAGVSLPSDYTVDGVSFAPTLRGEPSRSRPWIFSYLAGSRMLRDDRWLLEGDDRLYHCGPHRSREHYREITDSNNPDALETRQRFSAILEQLPAPDHLPRGLRPTEVKPGAELKNRLERWRRRDQSEQGQDQSANPG